jgi:peroxiredoxin
MLKLSLLLLLSALASASFALAPGDKMENFKLLDHTGKMHELYYLSDMEAVVLLVHGNGCPIARNALHTYKDLRDQYQDKGVAFLMINSNLQDSRNSIAKEAQEFGIDFPILVDETQLIGESLGIERTADAFVVDPKTWKVVYRGSLDDRLGYETQKFAAANNYVADALDAVLADKPVKLAAVEAKGCIVNLPEKDRTKAHAKISYAEDIAHVLIDNCVSCHRQGGIGPFAMSEYNMIKGFAPMIREVVRTKRMPPWHADPHIGKFSNDRSLSDHEAQTLVHWIEAGAPRGEGKDPLANYDKQFPEWGLGTPDLIVNIPASDIPATGVVDYKYITVKNPLDHDVWVRAVEIIPGSREVLHHVITTVGYANPKARNGFQAVGGMGGYVPGAKGEEFPEETGMLLKAGMDFQFQMHYTTYGKAATDASRLGIYFHDEKPKYVLEQRFMMNPKLRIPAGVKAHTEVASWTVDKDLELYTLLPHSHFRGKASDFIAKYPDGHEEVLLSVPNYDFNWQTTYELAEPKVLPAGTEIIHHTTWDNSTQNPANPDPTLEVTWGEQSWEEMIFGAIKYRYLPEAESADKLTQSDQ